MKHRPGTIALPPLMIAVLLLTAASLLACGPATQTEPQGPPASQAVAQDSDADPTPTSTPTPTPTPEPLKYPNLDATLQEIVARFEAEELSESEAAAQAHTYHGSSVLITVDLSANIDAVDAWMEGRDVSSRHTNATHIPPNIHAFVKVSLLGALSQQEGIIQVKETVPPWADLPSGQDPSGASGARGASGGTGAEGPSGDAAGPRLPLWLKGHPYHNLKGELDYLVDSYERGELTEAEAAAQTEDNQGSAVSVIVELINDPANTDAVIAWLKSKGVSAEYVAKHEAPHPHYVGAYVPVSMMGALSRQPGVIRITPPRPPNLPSEKPSGSWPAPQSDVQGQASSPTPTPAPTVVSQGDAAHRAPAWRTATYSHDGTGVKVGIIDTSFDGFGSLMGSGNELPPASKVEAQCYTSRMDTSPSLVIADCGDNVLGVSHHGTAVAQAVMDMAPEVSLYISNSALGAGNRAARTRLKQDVDWMITQGVKVINYSVGWGLTEGLGDGAPQEINAVLDTIDTAVASGIIWVNSAGNEHRRRWHGPFTDTNSPRDTYHDYGLNDDRNYINNVQVGKPIIVEMRWDDSWKSADCDVDLYLFRDGRSSPVRISIDSQFGRADDKPYEVIKYSPTVAGDYYLRIRKFRCLDASDLSWLQLYVSGPYHLEHFSTRYSIEFPAESKKEPWHAGGGGRQVVYSR